MRISNVKCSKGLSKFTALLVILASLSALAETEVLLEGDFFGRTTARFGASDQNKKFTLKKGTSGKIEEVQRFSSGNYALKIRISNGPHKDEWAWIHYNKKKRLVDLCKNEVEPGKVGNVSCTKTEALPEAKSAKLNKDATALPARAPNTSPKSVVLNPKAQPKSSVENEARKAIDILAEATMKTQLLNARNTPCPTGEASQKPDKNCVPDTLGPDPEIADMSDPKTRNESMGKNFQEMAKYLLPTAVTIQNQDDGIPASVLIAQAVSDSSFGSSASYANANNVFGMACDGSDQNKIALYDIKLKDSANAKVKARCQVKSPQGNYYLLFENPADSVLAYYHSVIQKKKPFYEALKKELKSGKSAEQALTSASTPENLKDSPELARYSNPQYRKQLSQMIDVLRKSAHTDEAKLCH